MFKKNKFGTYDIVIDTQKRFLTTLILQKIKTKIRDEFDEILKLLQFEEKGHDIFKRWYIDGRVYYHKVINPAQPRLGLSELRYIDPRKIRKVREIKKQRSTKGKSTSRKSID